MDMAGQVVRCALTVAASYYMMAAAIVVAHCIFDEGIAWNARKRLLLFFACILDEMISMFLPERTAATILIFFFYFFVIAYGCQGKYLSRILKVFGIVLYMVICVMMVCDIGGHYMLRGYSVLEDHGDGLGYIAVSLLIFLPLYYYMISQYFKKKIHISFRKREKAFLLCNLIYVFGFYAMIFFSEEAGHSMEKVLQMAMAAVMIIFVLGLPAYLFQNRARAYYRDRNDYQEAFMQAELAYFQQYKESQQETKRFRHDMKNHLSCLNIMLGEEKNDEAREYLESLLHQVMSLSPEIVTGDEMLDCIFSSKWNLMKKENINFEIDGVLDGGLHWKPIDVCSVFANALDNAIDACVRIPEGREREVRVSLRRTAQYYCMEIANTVQEDVDCEKLLEKGRAYTSKNNVHIHGFGLQNMRQTLSRHGGMMKMECSGRVVTLSLIIPRDA